MKNLRNRAFQFELFSSRRVNNLSAEQKGVFYDAYLSRDIGEVRNMEDIATAMEDIATADYKGGRLNKEMHSKLDERKNKISEEINKMEEEGNSKEEIINRLNGEASKKVEEKVNVVLKDIFEEKNEKAPTIQELKNDIFTEFAINRFLNDKINEYKKMVETAVNTYFNQKTVAVQTAGERIVGSNTNMEQQKALEKAISERQKIRGDTQEAIRPLREELAENWRAVKADIEHTTNPRRRGATITNYEATINPFDNVNNNNNPSRDRLNGVLMAEYAYAGRGEAGKQAKRSAYQEATKAFNDSSGMVSIYPRKFGSQQLELDLRLGNDDEVQTFSKFNTVRGMMKGFLRLVRNDQMLTHQEKLKYEQDFLFKTFSNLQAPEYKDEESKQIELLFSIKTPYEVFDLKMDWKRHFQDIRHMTSGSGGVIDPTTGKREVIKRYGVSTAFEVVNPKDRSMRKAFDGYLYGVYLFNGKNALGQEKARDSYIGVSKSVKKIPFPGTLLQADLSHGVGLGPFLEKSKNYSNDITVQHAIATIQMLSEKWFFSQNNSEYSKEEYAKHTEEIFSTLKNVDSQEVKLQILSKIKSPEVFFQIDKENEKISTLQKIWKLTKQNKYFMLYDSENPGAIKKYIDNPDASNHTVEEIESFVLERAKTYYRNSFPNFFIASIKRKIERLKNINPSDDGLRFFSGRIEGIEKDHESEKGMLNEVSLTTMIDRKYMERLEKTHTKYLELAEDLNLQIEKNKFKRSEVTAERSEDENADDNENEEPLEAQRTIDIGNRGGTNIDETEASIEKEQNEELEWEGEEKVESIFQNFVGKLTVQTGYSRMAYFKNDKGEIIDDAVLNGTHVERKADDKDIHGKKINQSIYVRVTHNNKKVWILQDYLKKLSGHESIEGQGEGQGSIEGQGEGQGSIEEQPITEKEKNRGSHFDRVFKKVKEDLSKPPYNSGFIYIFNDKELHCGVKKVGSNYELTYTGANLRPGKHIFNSFSGLRSFVEQKELDATLNSIQIKDRNLWEKNAKIGGIGSIGKIKEFKILADNKVSLVLDWKGAIKAKDAKLTVTVGRDGMIHCRIERKNVTVNKKNVRVVYASGFDQLMSEIAHTKNVSENLRKTRRKNPEELNKEVVERKLFNRNNFKKYEYLIGKTYDMHSYRQNSYLRTNLLWDNFSGTVSDWRRSGKNPTLEVRVTSSNSVEYKLYRTVKGKEVGSYGQVNSMEELYQKIGMMRSNPESYLNTPLDSMPIWGTENLWPAKNEPIRSVESGKMRTTLEWRGDQEVVQTDNNKIRREKRSEKKAERKERKKERKKIGKKS